VTAAQAFALLRELGMPAVTTSDAAAALGSSVTAAAKTLARLQQSGLVTSVRHGLWWLDSHVDPFRLPSYLTAPLESYLSLQTALHWHGVIEQIPEVVYAVSLARTQRITTRAATFSIHHVAPELFGGYDRAQGGVHLATVEKALFDFAYLSAGRSRLFTALPETEYPAGFRHAELRRWLARIRSARARTITANKLEQLLGSAAKPHARTRRRR